MIVCIRVHYNDINNKIIVINITFVWLLQQIYIYPGITDIQSRRSMELLFLWLYVAIAADGAATAAIIILDVGINVTARGVSQYCCAQ